MPTPKQPPAALKQASRRKLGRPFKRQSEPKRTAAPRSDDSPDQAAETLPLLQPPTISFRSFKVTLSVFRNQSALPAKLDRSLWAQKLYGSNRGETLDAYRFLGLVDEELAPTANLKALVEAYDTENWPFALRAMLERTYQPILASKISTLTAGGLLRTIRTVYRTENENTRKSCNFFVHATREAAMDTGPFLAPHPRSKPLNDNRTPPSTEPAARHAQSAETAVRILAAKLPTYEASWSDDVKRLWFGSYFELVQCLRN